jgi:monoterpene epsilon-lactone hydrolase
MNILPASTGPPPTRPSLRGRIATRLVRVVVKHWARGDPLAIVRRARKVFGLPDFLNILHSRGLEIEKVETPAVRGEWIRTKPCELRDRVLLYFHGGGYVSCSPRRHRPITTALARRLRCPVFAVDYRLAPEHPFPAAVDDATAAFTWLVESGLSPQNIAMAGDSAGGGLALATLVRLRRLGHSLPACAVGLSPWVDLTGAKEYRNSGSCSMFQPRDIAAFAKIYLDGASPESVEASPVFADLAGLPPLLTQVSTTELLFDDALRLHEKATSCGVKSTLRVYAGLPHVWQFLVGLVPEAGAALDEIADFVSATWRARAPHPTLVEDRSAGAPPKAAAAPAYNREDVTS